MEARGITKAVKIAGMCAGILVAGVLVSKYLGSKSAPPAQAEIQERAVRVQLMPARFEDVQVYITGYGEIRTRDTIVVSAEIAGKVVAIHPRLEAGEIISGGEILFAIDARDYRARLDEAESTVAQLQNTVERLNKQYAIDRDRLATYARTRDLAEVDFERAARLYAKDSIASQSFMDTKEMAYNDAKDRHAQLAQAVDLSPLRIQEAKNSLASARATRNKAQADMDRTVVSTPIDVRIKEVTLEAGEFVSPGDPVLTVADDSILEISLSINSREARNWLRFDEKRASGDRAWFNELTRTPVEIAWTEAVTENRWHGELHRVERFDPQTRTLTVVVRIDGGDAVSPDAGTLPLVEGMFCRVTIPGRIARNVVKLPAEAVGFDREASGYRTVYVATMNPEKGELRLQSRPVKESHLAGEFVYISEGLLPGDLVVTTRLVNPLENILLESEDPLPVEAD